MLDFGTSILAFIVAIGVLVAVHEFGHYWVARRLGFKVLRYSIGFGRPLVSWRGKAPDRIEYWISALPLGGYVKMLDEREGPVPSAESHRAFGRRPIPHRIAVLLAGPGFNFLFAIAAYWVMFAVGVPGIRPVIGAVEPDSTAARAGLATEDEIVTVGGEPKGTLEDATLAIINQLLDEDRVELTVRTAAGDLKRIRLDLEGRTRELTEPQALFTGLGFRPGPVLPARVDEIIAGSPAERAGLDVGDRIVRIDDTPVHGWDELVGYVSARPGVTAEFTVERGDEMLVLPIAIGTHEAEGQTVGRIGASSYVAYSAEQIDALRIEHRYGVLEALPLAAAKTWEMSALTLKFMGHMLVGDVSPKNMSGPIAIGDFAGQSARAGFKAFISFLAVVSISLGIINLMPVPLLDGGQVVYQLVEGIKGSPLSERAMMLGQQIGLLALAVLMTFVIYNDITRMFS
jgi:regulator of sigma E protease